MPGTGRRWSAIGSGLIFVLGLACAQNPDAANAPKDGGTTTGVPASGGTATGAPTAATTAGLEKAAFAGGCFWCMETAFEGLPGVKSVISGYAGGARLNPTYDEVSAGGTGHAESVQITYDPKQITYAQLLDMFWHNVDPTDSGGQFCDRGNQYRSEIFYGSDAQKRLAEASKRRIETAPHRFKGSIVTPIVSLTRFWPAEEYHQDFYKKDPLRYRTYRFGCGRDRRLKELWGEPGRQGHAK